MKKKIGLIAVLLVVALLTVWLVLRGNDKMGVPETASGPVRPCYVSQDSAMFTDGRRVFLERQVSQLLGQGVDVYEVTGGMDFFAGRSVSMNDAGVADGTLWIASHTAELGGNVSMAAELGGYSINPPREQRLSVIRSGAAGQDMYTFYVCGGRVIEQRVVYGGAGSGIHYALVDAEGNAAAEAFLKTARRETLVTDTYIAHRTEAGAEIFDLGSMQSYALPATLCGETGAGTMIFPQGVLLSGVLYYLEADGVHACDLAAGDDRLLVPQSAPEYFCIVGDCLYMVADDGRLTAYDLTAGAGASTGVAMAKEDRFVIADGQVYILEIRQLPNNSERASCRIETLDKAE